MFSRSLDLTDETQTQTRRLPIEDQMKKTPIEGRVKVAPVRVK